jgi:hypothetical protein
MNTLCKPNLYPFLRLPGLRFIEQYSSTKIVRNSFENCSNMGNLHPSNALLDIKCLICCTLNVSTERKILEFKAVLLNWEWPCPPRSLLIIFRHFRLSQWRSSIGIWCVETSDAAKCPASHKTGNCPTKGQ